MSAVAVPTLALVSSSRVVWQFHSCATHTALLLALLVCHNIFGCCKTIVYLANSMRNFECQFLTHCRYTLVQDGGIHNCHIEKEPEDIFIIRGWLHSTPWVGHSCPHHQLDVNSGSSLLLTRDDHFGIRLFVDRTETVFVSCHGVISNCPSCFSVDPLAPNPFFDFFFRLSG